MIVYNIRMDLQSDRTAHTDIVLTSGDVNAYRMEFDFYSQNKRRDVSGYVLCIRAKRADGVVVVDAGEITSEGKGIYDIKSNIYQVPGTLSMEVALATEEGCYVTTKELVMMVRKGYGNGGLNAGNTTPILAKLAENSARAERAALAANRFADITVAVKMLDNSSEPTVERVEENGKISLILGIPEGPQGVPGETPQKGVDYWTDEDKTEIFDSVDESIQKAILDSWEVAV